MVTRNIVALINQATVKKYSNKFHEATPEVCGIIGIPFEPFNYLMTQPDITLVEVKTDTIRSVILIRAYFGEEPVSIMVSVYLLKGSRKPGAFLYKKLKERQGFPV